MQLEGVRAFLFLANSQNIGLWLLVVLQFSCHYQFAKCHYNLLIIS
jgi:hypothetical protein